MSSALNRVLKETTIAKRKASLSQFIKETSIGPLSDEDSEIFRHIFSQFYTPNKGEEKYDAKTIKRVRIGRASYGTHCYQILIDNDWVYCSSMRLAGNNRTSDATLIRSMRYGIDYQIKEFREKNKLDPLIKCSISGNPLGDDAQVDHIKLFSEIVNEWRDNNLDATCNYNNNTKTYELDDPYLQSWREYHKETATLRWASKVGNSKRR